LFRKRIIPKKYNEAQESGSKPDVPSLKTLTSMNMKKGLMLSFHCLSADEIRCYIYINSQGMRFAPEDIRYLLPLFFDPEYENNETWPNSDEAKQLVKEMEQKLRDDGFLAFFNKGKNEKRPK